MSFASLPEKLKAMPNWVVWKSVAKDGRLTKIPFNVKTGQWAKADDPTTWTTFEQAATAADPLKGSDYDGVGFELGGTSIVGLDFDNAIDKKGVVDPYILQILWLLGNPYTDLSPSGKGLHAFVECEALPPGARKLSHDHIGIEIYHGREGGRYFTMPGQRVLGDGVPPIADISLPYLLITQNKDKKFRALWLGDTTYYDGDHSSADFALLLRLAKLTDNDSAKMAKYFSLSGLGMREKWTEREDYCERSIKAAIESNKTGKIVAPAPGIEFHSDAVPDPNGDYVIAPAPGEGDGWFPLGDISLVGGASGTGKTTFIFEMLHNQKQRFPVLGHTTFGRTFHVLAYDRGQNAFERTMRRLNLLPSDIPTTALPLSFGTDAVQNIINEIEKMNPAPSIIFLEGMDMLLDETNKKSVVAPFMRQMQEVAAHFHIALIGSLGAPKTKRGEDYAAKRDKLSGSEAWGRNCETVMVLEFAEEDDGTAPGRVLTVLPRNAKAEKFEMEFQSGRLALKPPSPEGETAPGPRYSAKVVAAMTFLNNSLQNGPVPSKQLFKEARDQENIAKDDLFTAARVLHVIKDGFEHGKPVWSFPPLHAGSNAPEPEEPVISGDLDYGVDTSSSL